MSPVNRNSIKNGFLLEMAKEAEAKGFMTLTTEEEREQSWRNMLNTNPNADQSVWIFAYGSLLWNPAFHHTEFHKATLNGYHRDFNLRTYAGRGSIEQPGLVLGLEQGGHCQGQVLKVDPNHIEEELHILWAREMIANSYCPNWYAVESNQSETIYAVAFVMDRNNKQYAGHLSFEERCHDLAHGEGALGCASDYLFETVRALQVSGIHDSLIEHYAEHVHDILHPKK